MVNLDFCIIALCITIIGIVAMLLAFCYKQEVLKMLFQSKTIVKNNEISSEMTLNIDKKECNK
jgi:hypothetical protein